MGPVGVPEMIVIFILALVLFGPKKLPEIGRTIGKALTEFRRASNDLKSTFERELHSLDQETQTLQASARQTARELSDHISYGTNPGDKLWDALEAAVSDKPAEPKAIEAGGQVVETTATEVVPAIEGTVPRGSASQLAHETSPEATTLEASAGAALEPSDEFYLSGGTPAGGTEKTHS